MNKAGPRALTPALVAVLLALAVAVVDLAPRPSAAADVVADSPVEVWRGGLPPGFSVHVRPCSDGEPADSDGGYWFGHAWSAPRGSGAMLVLSPSTRGDTRLSYALPSLSAETVWRASVSGHIGDPLGIEISIPERGLVGRGEFAAPMMSQWAPFDAIDGVVFSWSANGGETFPSSTAKAFLASHPDVAGLPARVTLLAGRCNPYLDTSFRIDDVVVGGGSGTQTLDFEGPRVPVTLRDYQRIRYGTETTLRASITDDDGGSEVPVPGVRLRLLARSEGEPRTSVVGYATTGSAGVAAIRVRPARTTRYVWQYAEPEDFPLRSAEDPARVVVEAAVELGLSQSRPRSGQPVTAVARVRPCAVKSVQFYLLRRRRSFDGTLGRVEVDGCRARLRFAAPPAGHWWMRAASSMQPGLRSGRSESQPLTSETPDTH